MLDIQSTRSRAQNLRTQNKCQAICVVHMAENSRARFAQTHVVETQGFGLGNLIKVYYTLSTILEINTSPETNIISKSR